MRQFLRTWVPRSLWYIEGMVDFRVFRWILRVFAVYLHGTMPDSLAMCTVCVYTLYVKISEDRSCIACLDRKRDTDYSGGGRFFEFFE